MSRATLDAPTIFPAPSLIGETVSEMSTRAPALVCRTVSKCSIFSPLRRRASTSFASEPRSAGMIKVIFRPTASASEYPNNFSALRFQDVMMPSSVMPMMASWEESTIAASRALARSAFSARSTNSCWRTEERSSAAFISRSSRSEICASGEADGRVVKVLSTGLLHRVRLIRNRWVAAEYRTGPATALARGCRWSSRGTRAAARR